MERTCTAHSSTLAQHAWQKQSACVRSACQTSTGMWAAGDVHVRLTGRSGKPWAAHMGDDVGAVRDPERAPAKSIVKLPRERGVAHARRAVREHAADALGQLRARLPQRRRKHHRQRAPQRVACPNTTAVVLQGLGIKAHA